MENIAHASIRTRDTDRAFGGIAGNKNRTLRNISNLFQNMRRVFFVEKGCPIKSSSTFGDHYLFKKGKRRGNFFGVMSRSFFRVYLTVDESSIPAAMIIVRARSRILLFFPVFISFCFVQNYGGDFCMRNFSVSVV